MTSSKEDLEKIRARLPGSNIDETSFLATDYLNHLNEAVMMLEMVPDMPDLFEEVQEWQPKSYQQHFLDSSFQAKDLAVAAYEAAPVQFRTPFDKAVELADQGIKDSKDAIEQALAVGDMVAIAALVPNASTHIRHMIDIASAVIHGNSNVLSPEKIMEIEMDWQATLSGSMMAGGFDHAKDDEEEEEAINIGAMAQDDIDALFD
ncbi:hypothetical protein O4H49_09180 [Kiloniella laminariae]|uniref:Uncharacterized protein n=1 Tax=Kiloniella laminariae TaxID=454162 RepID=A0ABT4LLU8_9PROT|nr:hypothetical protein [Kiloniella laminariae]MCZ4280947.1 hypothetical protein [Kiloniella laminariae]